ncbi:PH domain-like protein [Choiromyces venosus 120613-1]|uniref:PH domain-like protein n=1 Tax=Choiromyces venosus 120613-1 TaxID=1336337 RepID=A0A3N4K0B3_9PEZI|nr:PH domain-like protein [Choiromyces venosus 120613-1]
MPPQSRTIPDVNHTVLSRYLPRLQKILASASYAVLYTYSHESGTWQKSNTEGSLFICSLALTTPPTTSQEEYTIILLNRRGLQNFTYALTDPGNIEYTEGGEYVMLQNEEDEKIVYGIWVYAPPGTSSEGDRTKIAEWVKECAGRYVEGVARASKEQEQQQQQQAASGGGGGGGGGGRSISLTELFQGSSSPAAASIPQPQQQQQPQHHHQYPTQTYIPAQHQQEGYFHHQRPPAPPPPHHHQPQEATGGDALMRLFENASGKYMGGGTTASGHS